MKETVQFDFTTIGDICNSINLLIENEHEAERFMAEYVDRMQSSNHQWTREQCEKVCMENVGYCAGYIGDGWTAMAEVKRILGASHPVYG